MIYFKSLINIFGLLLLFAGISSPTLADVFVFTFNGTGRIADNFLGPVNDDTNDGNFRGVQVNIRNSGGAIREFW